MQRSEAANERCSNNRDALKIGFLNLYVRKVLFKVFKKYLWMSYFNFWCIWNKFLSSKVVTKRKIVIQQLTKELFSREASVDKCIKCSRKFCNILWKTWLTESLPVNVLELQPNTLFKKRLLSQIISKVDVRKFSLTWLFVWSISQISGKPSVVEYFC